MNQVSVHHCKWETSIFKFMVDSVTKKFFQYFQKTFQKKMMDCKNGNFKPRFIAVQVILRNCNSLNIDSISKIGNLVRLKFFESLLASNELD